MEHCARGQLLKGDPNLGRGIQAGTGIGARSTSNATPSSWQAARARVATTSGPNVALLGNGTPARGAEGEAVRERGLHPGYKRLGIRTESVRTRIATRFVRTRGQVAFEVRSHAELRNGGSHGGGRGIDRSDTELNTVAKASVQRIYE